jgi:hypothetical protein
MKNLTPEMIEKAKTVKSEDELLELAKASNVEMTADEAATYFAQLNPKSGEISDDDLDNVSGGGCRDGLPLYRNYTMVHEFFCTNCFRVYPASKCKVIHYEAQDDVAYCPDCKGEVYPAEEFVHGKI